MNSTGPAADVRTARALRVAAGAAVGTAAVVLVDVQVSLAAIDVSDPATLPNMAPQTRYFFAPVLYGFVLVFAAIADALVRAVVGAFPLRRPAFYAVLGFCYSLALVALPLHGLLPRHPASLLVGPAIAAIAAGSLRRCMSIKEGGNEC
jgi:hypothetical protein